MKKIILLFNTLRYLRLKQLAYRVYYRLRKPYINALAVPEMRGVAVPWPDSAFLKPATEDGEIFTFLGETAKLHGDWNSAEFTKLWLYNLHYQDDLNAIGAEERLVLCRQMVDTWVEGNPPLDGNGWEPYCLSLRIVNWVKFFSRLDADNLREVWLLSLAQQADALEQQLEFHILANHLFANAKALVFVGVFLGGEQGDRCLQKGLQLLDKEIAEQFLADGAHYELSPMYHSTLLWDLADLLCLQQNTQLPELNKRASGWQQRFLVGLGWLQKMVHPDREISFFNDATIGIAPTLNDLLRYSAKLGIEAPIEPAAVSLSAKRLEASGYTVVDWPSGHRLIADVARVGPDYQPGHAHADTLSCELSLFGQRVLVNSGISQYGEDAERHRQRSTAAHNTLEVDGENSSEVWAGFRVARRARPYGIGLQTGDEQVNMTASHDGYHRLPGKVTHQRHWLAEPSSLTITDKVTGHFHLAIVHWHFHPEIKIESLDSQLFHLHLPKGQKIILQISGAEAQLLESTWHPGFGLSIKNYKLELNLVASKIITRIEWSSI